ncbi:TetR/AcrR family transcriptional regulator [Brevibacillus sp. HB1.2]|uniref:TetR/AcrR family transcriptional regulator n=1 Tax=Brevibacillus TaxID=55080 RepID=UPI00037C7E5E|nr:MULTISPECIES: TetR/AcrR family transcriptional regulator [unclassified Brevibacillus]ATF14752.1 TetR/AcrR family transcriptional regulator [Brevibacillus brevis X23]NRS19226.1 TetR/AcrR family transcriptional regulator [Brevibacillus sp. HB1.4B]NTU22619.1 TetR/AcrR family transcriptional regulator [Brevibacillus sp. HB1.2]NTU32787.1 TetR/AcrR family transcriptional regulator [Brevibacillus sp. HB1.1]
MAEALSLREKKKAKTKFALLDAALELIGDGSFRNVLVDDICERAEVSKVTFFKFFPQKEELLIYYMSIWQAECFVELRSTGKRGWEAVRHIFAKVTCDSEKQPGIMLSLISFLAEQKMHPCVPLLSDAELYLRFPEEEEREAIRATDLHEMLQTCVQEAAEDGQLALHLSEEEAVILLFSIFYGAYLTAHLFHVSDYMAFYELHLKSLIR